MCSIRSTDHCRIAICEFIGARNRCRLTLEVESNLRQADTVGDVECHTSSSILTVPNLRPGPSALTRHRPAPVSQIPGGRTLLSAAGRAQREDPREASTTLLRFDFSTRPGRSEASPTILVHKSLKDPPASPMLPKSYACFGFPQSAGASTSARIGELGRKLPAVHGVSGQLDSPSTTETTPPARSERADRHPAFPGGQEGSRQAADLRGNAHLNTLLLLRLTRMRAAEPGHLGCASERLPSENPLRPTTSFQA